MSSRSRRIAAFLVVLACALQGGVAQADGGDNVATALNEQDSTQAFDFAWDISRERNVDVVDNLNSALAHAHCVHCGATAIAFQIVLVSGSPSRVAPQNTAEAANIGCTECTSVAEARQFVRVVPAPVRFTGTGRAMLAHVKERLASLQYTSLAPADVHQVVEDEATEVRDVLDTQLVLKSNPDKEPNVLGKRALQSADRG